ncbi:MAG: aminotransferase class I/II-fold pyridoxal phosphate-dependent enzyme, partial [Pseudomonadota bacterium]
HALSALLRRRLAEAGLKVACEAGPIVPVLTGGAQAALDVAEGLWQRGVFAPAVRPPTVPQGASRIRLTVTAAHEEQDIEKAAQALVEAARESGL